MHVVRGRGVDVAQVEKIAKKRKRFVGVSLGVVPDAFCPVVECFAYGLSVVGNAVLVHFNVDFQRKTGPTKLCKGN